MYFTTSNKALVRDVATVRKIWESYDVVNVVSNLRSRKGKAVFSLEQVGEWPPEARRLPRREDFPDERAWQKAVDERENDEYDDETFIALLKELAPHLKSELLILTGTTIDGGFAKSWSVQPGGGVTTVSISLS
jgi:hypothetical protein